MMAAPTPPLTVVDDHLDPRVAVRPRPLDRGVGGAVVDDVDPVDEVGDAAQRLRDEELLVVGGDDDGDALALEHDRT